MEKNRKIYIRNVLMSSGEFTQEAVINHGQINVYESAPQGLTLGQNEASLLTTDKGSNISFLNSEEVLNLSQEEFDALISSKLFSQLTTALSLAFLRYSSIRKGFINDNLYKYIATSNKTDISFPYGIFNVLNGGKHAGNDLEFCEFMIIPKGLSIDENIIIASEIYLDLRKILIDDLGIEHTLVGREGGFAPNLFTNADALELMSLVIKNSNYRLGQDLYLGLDVAADEFFKDGKYNIKDAPRPLSRGELTELYVNLSKDYGLLGLEDPLDQEDWAGWTELSHALPASVMIIGDDLIATNAKRLQKAIDNKSCNAVIVKPNQIGTVTETIELIRLATANKVTTIASHRSGETNDSFIADFAVGMGTNYAKFGAPDRGERVAKYNRLLEIESYLSR